MSWRAGSFPWLLAHDLRLSARNFAAQFSGRSQIRLGLFLVAVAVGLHLAAFSAAQWLDEVAKRPGGEAQVEIWFAAGVAMTLSLIVAQAMISAMRVISSRSDFDLLFSSPVHATAVLGSRAFAIAFEGAATAAMLLLPLANAGAWLGHPRWLALYPVLLSSALAGAGIGLGFAMLFLIALGPRRGRTLLQVAATLIIACCALAGQAISLLPAGIRAWLSRAVASYSPGVFSDHASWVWLPVRAARGDPAAIGLWLLFCAALFTLAIQLCALARGGSRRRRDPGRGPRSGAAAVSARRRAGDADQGAPAYLARSLASLASSAAGHFCVSRQHCAVAERRRHGIAGGRIRAVDRHRGGATCGHAGLGHALGRRRA